MYPISGRHILLMFAMAWQCVSAQTAFVFDAVARQENKSDLTPYTYLLAANRNSIFVNHALKDLPVNKRYTFYTLFRNRTNDRIKKIVQFGNRYVNARNILIISLDKKASKQIIANSNKVELQLLPGESKLLVFDIDELDRADPKKLTVELLSADAFEKSLEKNYRQQAFFLGLFSFLVVFNIILYLVTRWRVYLKYALYILSALLYFSYYFGILQAWVPQLAISSVNIAYTWYSFIFITYFYFLNDFGAYKQYVPMAHRLLNIGIVFKVTETLLNTLLHLLGFNFIYSGGYSNMVIALEIVLMGFILFYILKNKNIRGRLVVLASIMLIIMAIIEQTKLFPGVDSAYFVELGIVGELLTFSVGLGYVTRLYYNEKRNNELLYLNQLIANEKLQKEATEKLETLVRQRTRELQAEKRRVEEKNAENELLLAEIHHRVKNNLQVVSSLLSLQERSVLNKDAKVAIQESRDRLRSMELVHKMLYSANSYSGIEMKEYVSKLAEGLIDSFGKDDGSIMTVIKFDPVVLDIDTAVPLGLILNELIVNSIKHGKPVGERLTITVEIEENDTQVRIRIADNGNGKADRVESSGSFGLKIIQSLVRQLNGQMLITETGGLEYAILIKRNNFRNYET